MIVSFWLCVLVALCHFIVPLHSLSLPAWLHSVALFDRMASDTQQAVIRTLCDGEGCAFQCPHSFCIVSLMVYRFDACTPLRCLRRRTGVMLRCCRASTFHSRHNWGKSLTNACALSCPSASSPHDYRCYLRIAVETLRPDKRCLVRPILVKHGAYCRINVPGLGT